MNSTSAVINLARAVAETAACTLANEPQPYTDGRWVDADRYFLTIEALREDGTIVRSPHLSSGGDLPVCLSEPEWMIDLIVAIDCQQTPALCASTIRYDYIDDTKLAASVGGVDYTFCLATKSCLHSERRSRALRSPDGLRELVLTGPNIAVRDILSGRTLLETHTGESRWRYGQAAESCRAYLDYQQAPTPIGIWSSTGKWALTHLLDERAINTITLIESLPKTADRPVTHSLAYPLPGQALPLVTPVLLDMERQRVLHLSDLSAPLTFNPPITAGMAWFSDQDRLWYITTDRYWKTATLSRVELTSGEIFSTIVETAPLGYLDLCPFGGVPNVRTLDATDEVIWYSERDGWGHLWLYNALTGAIKNQITRGSWQVREIVDVDAIGRRVFFTAGGICSSDPARRALCSVGLDGGAVEVLVGDPGADVSVRRTSGFAIPSARANSGLSPHRNFAVCRFGRPDLGDSVRLVDLATSNHLELAASHPADSQVHCRRFSFPAADGVTELHGIMFLPANFSPELCYPIIDFIYPGPQVPHQPQNFRSIGSAPARSLAALGFITLMIDTRGVPISSRAFHQGGYPSLLQPQLADHIAALEHLGRQCAFVNAKRVGVLGHSGGGLAAARLMLEYPHIFHAGASVSGNHDNRNLLACWADKYSGPLSDVGLMSEASGSLAKFLSAPLLIVTGDLDETSHPSQSLRFAQQLIELDKPVEIVLVPGEGHDILNSSDYAISRIWEFFLSTLCEVPTMLDLRFSYSRHALARLGLGRLW